MRIKYFIKNLLCSNFVLHNFYWNGCRLSPIDIRQEIAVSKSSGTLVIQSKLKEDFPLNANPVASPMYNGTYYTDQFDGTLASIRHHTEKAIQQTLAEYKEHGIAAAKRLRERMAAMPLPVAPPPVRSAACCCVGVCNVQSRSQRG